MEWEILALRYGFQDRLTRENFLHVADDHNVPMPLDYFLYLLRSGAREILVDTGFSEATAERRGGAAGGRHIVRHVGRALRDAGADPAAIAEVVITHLHYDHAGNLGLFPNARFHLQEREMAFATGRHMCFGCMRRTFEVEDVVDMVRAVYADRVAFHDGDAEIAPGASLHRVGGHTDGLQMVRVATARGPVVLAGDASHYYANMERAEPFPGIFNLGDMLAGWRKAVSLAGGDKSLVVPGHDPEVRRRYSALPGSEGETVQLHLPPGR
jgi:glyoxylase-like metal-dependent hydrolase (beta-lactamase superfamily II)